MSDLGEFMEARLAAMEKALIEYREHRQHGPHVNYEGQDWKDYDEYDSCARCISTAKATPYSDVAFGLAEVAAKRQIIDEHPILTGYRVCTRCSDFAAERGELIRQVPGPCLTLRLLALPYARHPEYQQEWAV
jgi:hypothetical protein